MCILCGFQEKSKEKKVIPGRKEEEKTRKKLTITETSVGCFFFAYKFFSKICVILVPSFPTFL